MKSQRGQIQESNFLADKIEQQVVRIRPYLPAIAGLILVGIVGLIGYGVYTSRLESRAAEAWTEFYFSDTQAQDLDRIVEDYDDTTAGLWAKMTSGDRAMSQAMEKWNIDSNISKQRFEEAARDYEPVVQRASDSFLKSRALYGLAQAHEGLGKRTEAIDAYRQILSLTGLPSEYLTEVNARIKWLEGKEGELFFTWYNEERKDVAAPTGTSPIPGLPNIPDFQFPPLQSNPLPSSPPADVPAADAPPADAPPADAPPADAPAEPSPPSDSQPPTQSDPTKSEDKP